jgi:muramoyltetrapeptide carboxypeptidase LdcA involved in peptidoglycan recycling
MFHRPQSKMTKPPRVRVGDRVAAVTLSWGGPGAIPHRYQAGKAQFEREFGVQVVEMKHALQTPEWVARNPKARADDLMEAFADPTIKGIISTIGGNDSVRLLPHLDLDVIRRNPKVVMGYSDTTITHMACLKAGLVSFYGPSFMAGFAENGGMFPYMTQSVRRAVFSTDGIGVIEPNLDGWTVEHLEWTDQANQQRKRKLVPSTGWRILQGTGMATGHLIGGCADVLEFLKGTEWWPETECWNGAILFLETSEDAPGPQLFKDWLRNYATQGILQRLAGLLVGRPGGASLTCADFEEYDQVLLTIVRDELGLESLPIISRMDFGHTDPMFVLPYGISTTIDCQRHALEITESAVT